MNSSNKMSESIFINKIAVENLSRIYYMLPHVACYCFVAAECSHFVASIQTALKTKGLVNENFFQWCSLEQSLKWTYAEW